MNKKLVESMANLDEDVVLSNAQQTVYLLQKIIKIKGWNNGKYKD